MYSLNIIIYMFIYVYIGKIKREVKEEKGSRKYGRRGIVVNIV